MHTGSDEAVKKAVEDWINGLATDLYNTSI
jgi:hypothetical protein